jgi:hypothetical protein
MSDTIKPGLEILAKSQLRKRSERSCTECADIKERYIEVLEEEEKQLIAFRGHGTRRFYHPRIQPFSEDEVETIIKLFILGVRKFNLTVGKNKPVVDVSLDGVRIECQIREEATTLVYI